jgi:hypothetical protein
VTQQSMLTVEIFMGRGGALGDAAARGS